MRAIEFVKKYRITGEMISGPDAFQRDGWEGYDFNIRLSHKGTDIDIPFSVGIGWDVGEFTGGSDLLPSKTVAEVVDNVADSLRNREREFDDYLSDFFSDVGAMTVAAYREQERTWRAVVEQGRAIEAWLTTQAMVEDMESVTE